MRVAILLAAGRSRRFAMGRTSCSRGIAAVSLVRRCACALARARAGRADHRRALVTIRRRIAKQGHGGRA